MVAFALAAALCLAATCANAQNAVPKIWDSNANGWFMYLGDHRVRGKWGLHLEGQWRRHDVITNWQQLLLRPAVNYQLNPNWMLTAGYAYVKTHPYGAHPINHPFPEHRLYQQLLVKQRAGTTRLQHRFRLEQRFLGQMIPGQGRAPQLDHWRYQNRFRQFIKAEVPLARKGEKSPWYAAFYNEIFFNFAPKSAVSVFDQNRAYAALGHELGKTGKIEIGYLNQLLARRRGALIESNHTLQVTIFSNLAFGK